MLKILASDLGASNGRSVLGQFDGQKVTVEEIHRFPNYPVRAAGRLYWDVLRLLHEIKTGLSKSVRLHGNIDSMAVDTWGSDFGLLDEKGRLLSNPYHYRDSYTYGMLEKVLDIIPMEELYDKVGAEMSEQSTLFMLYSLAQHGNHPQFQLTKKILMMPDLFNYFLSGEMATEYTIASTSRLIGAQSRNWLFDIIDKLNIPKDIFTDIISPGTVLGNLSSDLVNELGCNNLKVIATASHDTASAVAAIPAQDSDLIYISSGTWSVVGIEAEQPIITKRTLENSLINEGGVCGKITFLKNVMGLWFVEECRRDWDMRGESISYGEMDEMVTKAPLFESFINTGHSSLVWPGDMPNRIVKFCSSTDQTVPAGKGEIINTINQSLAMEYKRTIINIEEICGRSFSKIFIVGGGVKNKILCQYTANATGKEVVAGYPETVCVGNILTQAMALGEIKNLSELRQIAKDSFPLEYYKPKDTEAWDSAYEKYLKIIK